MSRLNPPALMIYSEAASKYEEADEVCVARWATSGYGRHAGDICGEYAGYHIGDVDLCNHHYRRAVEGMRADAIMRHKKTKDEIDAAVAEQWRQHDQADRLEQERRSIVYYLYRPSDDMIKIGTTTNWKNRLGTHRAEHGDLILLLAHAGGRKAERDMHLKFAKLRPGASEWFQPGRPLLSWIRRQRAKQRDQESNLPLQHDLGETRTLLNALDARYLKAPLPLGKRAAARAPRPQAPLVQPAVRDYAFLRESEHQMYCRSKEAAEYVGMTARDLKRWCDAGEGPESFDLGTIVHYRCDDLKPWAESVIGKLAADPAA